MFALETTAAKPQTRPPFEKFAPTGTVTACVPFFTGHHQYQQRRSSCLQSQPLYRTTVMGVYVCITDTLDPTSLS